jgi:hypothetical protein
MQTRRALTALLFSANAFGAEVAGVHLEPSVKVGGQSLRLVSCGVRDTLWMDAYAAGLYVPQGSGPQAARVPTRAKAVRMKIINATYLPDDIPEKWRDVLQRELKHEPMAMVRQAYDGLSDGDVVMFTYLPAKGVTMSVNGRQITRTSGHSLIDSILHAWAEKDPVAGRLHRLKLEHPC